MPDRIIRERARRSESLAQLSAEAERLFWRLVTIADDVGRMRDNPVLVLAEAFPVLADRIKPDDIERWLSELAGADILERYTVSGKGYMRFPRWAVHQPIDEPNLSEYPGPDRSDPKRNTPGRVFSTPKALPLMKKPSQSTLKPRAPDRAHVPCTGATGTYGTSSSPDSISGTGVTGSTERDNSTSRSDGIPVATPERSYQLILPELLGDAGMGGLGGNPATHDRHYLSGGKGNDVITFASCPKHLEAFDAVLKKLGRRYLPTANYYERLMLRYGTVRQEDLIFEAEAIYDYLTTVPKGLKRTDLVRFTENWLDKSADKLWHRAKMDRGTQNGNGNGRKLSMAGPGQISDEARRSAKRIEDESRARGD